MNGAPYDYCSYLEVTGPHAAKALILKNAKARYQEPNQEALAAVADKVVIRVATVTDRRCSGRVPVEVIFVDKKTDKVALRLPLSSDAVTLQNGFGVTWTSTDGVATVGADVFKAALSDGKFNVIAVMDSGNTREMKAGLGNVMWSGGHTQKALAP